MTAAPVIGASTRTNVSVERCLDEELLLDDHVTGGDFRWPVSETWR